MRYSEAISFLYGLQPSGIKLGLENMRRLSGVMGCPEESLRVIHIGGTNGKGTVSTALASILKSSGKRVGLYTSPHFLLFEERIRVNGVPISQEELIRCVEEVAEVLGCLKNEGIQPTFFEVTTALAFSYFREQKVDFAVVEVGLGGRLDSTNVVNPVLSVITSIGMDHQDYLGNDIRSIAREKAGIIKQGVPVLLGELEEDAEEEILKVAVERENRVERVPRVEVLQSNIRGQVFRRGGEEFSTSLLGEHQLTNLSLAMRAGEILVEEGELDIPVKLQEGIGTFSLEGRLQVLRESPLLIVDVAHNVDGIKRGWKTWKDINQGRLPECVVFGCMRDKDYKEILEVMDVEGVDIYLVKLEGERALSVDEMEKELQKARVLSGGSLTEVVQKVLGDGFKKTVYAVGSFYLVEAFFRSLQLQEERSGSLGERSL